MKVHFASNPLAQRKKAIVLNDAKRIPMVQGHPNVIQLKEVI